jgi:hypothetical protein
MPTSTRHQDLYLGSLLTVSRRSIVSQAIVVYIQNEEIRSMWVA